MNKAELYFSSHAITIKDVVPALMQFKRKMKTYDDHKILDIGCGPGDITADYLLPFVPSNGQLVGIDLSPEMIQFANSKYCDPRLKFEIMDIANPNFSKKYECFFNTVFSFYCLHWVQNQLAAMKNIFDVLQNGGEAMLIILANTPFFTLYEKFSSSRKWGQYMFDFKKAISPYFYSSNPEADARKLLSDVGFIINDCICATESYTYPNEEELITLMEALNPFSDRIPKHMVNDFHRDCKNFVCNSKLTTVSEETGEVTYKYLLIKIHVTKPNNNSKTA